MKIHRQTVSEALAGVRSREAGLTAAEAAQRLAEYGANRLASIPKPSLALRFFREFTHFFALILWLAAALAFVAEVLSPGEGMLTLGLAIVAVIGINGVFSFWQEYRAEKALDALERLLPRRVGVYRDGALSLISAEEVVPGEVIAVEEGDNVCADCRLIEAHGLRVNLATVTGESLPKARSAEPSDEEDLLHADNVLLAGTTVVSGQGRAVVFATGAHTEFSKIAHLTQSTREAPSPLQKEIVKTTRRIGMVALGVGFAFFLIGQFVGLTFWANFTFAIGIIVAFVPEGLLPTVTLALTMAAQRMAKRNALIRHLPAVEALGSASVICTDKTGTLTQNRMAVRRAYVDGEERPAEPFSPDSPARRDFLAVARFCHNLRISAQGSFLGDPMEIALTQLGADPYPAQRVDEISFDTDRKRLSVLSRIGQNLVLHVKGAPETVLPLCGFLSENGPPRPLGDDDAARIRLAQQELALRGYRVLALAHRTLPEGEPRERWERSLTFVGLAAIEDPPRPEVPAAIAKCREAGIRVVMVTGDHPTTALAIAREIGLIRTPEPRMITGKELRKLSNIQLQLAFDSEEIHFARLTADQKHRIVSALRRKGEIVAVTGDGVNDAPALKSADVGIAMGISGTEVAREAADMVLLDDNFASIVAAIEEGRAVYGNLRKFLTYILTSNIPEAVPYLAFILLGIPLPLTILQILAVDLGTDLLPALALAAEPGRAQDMKQPPRPRSERLLNGGVLARSYLFLGPMEAAVSMAAFFHVLRQGGWTWGTPLASDAPLYLAATTATLSAIVVAQVANLFLCKESRDTSFGPSFFRNRLIFWGILAELALIALIDYTPWGNRIFGTAPLDLTVWLSMIPYAAAMTALEEGRKRLLR